MERRFNPLLFRAKKINEKSSNGYRIYSKSGKVETVEAETAAIALENSKIENPAKIQKISITKKNIFSESELGEFEASNPKKAEKNVSAEVEAYGNYEKSSENNQESNNINIPT